MSDTQQERESKALARLLDQLKSTKGVSKADFAKRHKIPGGASMISQHLSGHRPINLAQALSYVMGLNQEGIRCTLEDISPRLNDGVDRARFLQADHIRPQSAVEEPGARNVVVVDARTHQSWPFLSVTKQDFERLSSDSLYLIETLIHQLIDRQPPKHKSPDKKPRAAKSA